MRFELKGWRSYGLLLGGFWSALSLVRIVAPFSSYNKWDNFEYFTPTLLEAHSRWLKGLIPLWSSHQHLGESLLNSSQPGIFYLPYTCAVALVTFFSYPEKLMFVLAFFHLSLALLGWAVLFRKMNIRRSISYVAALSVVSGGYVSLIIPVWTFVGGFLCWMPWILYGALEAMESSSKKALCFPVSLALSSCLGHPQMWTYTLVWAFFAILFFGFSNQKGSRNFTRLFGLLIVGFLMCAPAVLPVFIASKGTALSDKLPLDIFLSRSVPVSHLSSFILPTFDVSINYFRQPGCLSFFQGSWMPIAVVAALFTSGESKTKKYFYAAIGLSFMFVIFSLGEYTPFYVWTYKIPIWGAFRWPFKFLLFSNVSFGIAAAVGLELVHQRFEKPSEKKYSIGTILLGAALLGGLLFLITRHASLTRHNFLFVGMAMLSFVFVMSIQFRWARIFLLGLVLLQVPLVRSLADKVDLKTYHEPLGKFGPDVLGVDPAYRLLPISSYGDTPLMQPLDLFQSASLNGYDSVTGCTNPLIPLWYKNVFPSNLFGLMPTNVNDVLLGSNFLKMLGVRYVLVHNLDQVGLRLLEQHHFQLEKKMDLSSVYEQAGALPRVYFANQILATSPDSFFEGMMKNKANLYAAYLNEIPESKKLPMATVVNFRSMNDGIEVNVKAPEGGFLIFTALYYPDWVVLVDGIKRAPYFVNGLVMGIDVPAGTQHVRFKYQSEALQLALILFLGGLIALLYWSFARRNPK